VLPIATWHIPVNRIAVHPVLWQCWRFADRKACDRSEHFVIRLMKAIRGVPKLPSRPPKLLPRRPASKACEKRRGWGSLAEPDDDSSFSYPGLMGPGGLTERATWLPRQSSSQQFFSGRDRTVEDEEQHLSHDKAPGRAGRQASLGNHHISCKQTWRAQVVSLSRLLLLKCVFLALARGPWRRMP
jgi:hypothetical protein